MNTGDGRGYFGRVGRVVGWFLATVAALLGIVQLLRLFHATVNDDVRPPHETARLSLLEKCNCSDDKTHLSEDFHASHCKYRKWYADWKERHKRKEKDK